MEHEQHNGNLVCVSVKGLSMPLCLVSRLRAIHSLFRIHEALYVHFPAGISSLVWSPAHDIKRSCWDVFFVQGCLFNPTE